MHQLLTVFSRIERKQPIISWRNGITGGAQTIQELKLRELEKQDNCFEEEK